jgi:hypothetical protein
MPDQLLQKSEVKRSEFFTGDAAPADRERAFPVFLSGKSRKPDLIRLPGMRARQEPGEGESEERKIFRIICNIRTIKRRHQI